MTIPFDFKRRVLVIAGTALFLYASEAALWADTVYFKDGKVWNGIIESENDANVELDIGFDTAKLEKYKIRRIRRSDAAETRAVKRKLKDTRVYLERKRRQRESMPKEVRVTSENGHVIVPTLINGKARCDLLLDTGASVIILSRDVAQELGIQMDRSSKIIHLQVADGRRLRAAFVILPSVKVEGVEARDVPAAVLFDKVNNPRFKDGLLGMSFLNRFSFRIDYRNKKLVLQKLAS